MREVQLWFEKIQQAFAQYLIGQENNLNLILCTLLAGGHALLLGLPGTGKTFMVKVLAQLLKLKASRIQFTPDLLPADITGYSIYRRDSATMEFIAGPLFANFILADEINRTPPRTQAALLEAMEEKQVTIEGQTRPLKPPFFVLATQNPLELAGTYPLPEAQLDRFMVLIQTPKLSREQEIAILHNSQQSKDGQRVNFSTIKPVSEAKEILALQSLTAKVTATDKLLGYIVDLIRATREHRMLRYGASPRAAIHLLSLARVWAAKEGRDYVIPDDVQALYLPAMEHRLALTAESELVEVSLILQDILKNTTVPR